MSTVARVRRPAGRLAAAVVAAAAIMLVAGSPARAGAGGPGTPGASPSPSTTVLPPHTCENGTLKAAGTTWLSFTLGPRCRPLAATVTVFEGSPTGPSTTATATGESDTITVYGLVPDTSYWYTMGPAVDGPVRTLPERTCTATYRVVDRWAAGGYQAEVRVTAGRYPITGWTLRWTLAGGQTVTQSWNTVLSVAGTSVTAGNATWNGSLAAGASTTAGLLGTGGDGQPPVPGCTAGGEPAPGGR